MDGMQGFYGQQGYQGMDLQDMSAFQQDGMINTIDPGDMTANVMGQPQTLHQIISQNNEQLMRSRNSAQAQPHYRHHNNEPNRRASISEFTSTMDSGLADFQFDPNPIDTGPTMLPMAQRSLDPRRVRSRDDLSLDVQFSQMNANFADLTGMPYSAGIEPSSTFVPHSGYSMSHDMDSGVLPLKPTTMALDSTMLAPGYSQSPTSHSYPMAFGPTNSDQAVHAMGPSMLPNQMSNMNPIQRVSTMPNMPNIPQAFTPSSNSNRSIPSALTGRVVESTTPSQADTPSNLKVPSRRQSMSSASPIHPNSLSNVQTSHSVLPANSSQFFNPIIPPSRYANAYSSSGFDMLGVLMRVATRRRPEINIGPVDLSCAFVVCDIAQYDLPIVYCSDMFERLTGYTKHEILGRNCRFLQAPDGKVQPGVKRKYVDDRSVLYLKNQIQKRAEAQLSLINYRKGGQPFMNLLTMIPITFDSDDYKFYVGFQVDLVEQPSSVAGRNPDGSYSINYNRSALPAYALPPPVEPKDIQEMGQTIPRDEVSQVLGTLGRGESDSSKRLWDKILLENADDVVHVLSLKGLFLYLSPACKKVLEYDAGELVGMALSSVCHPSDIVPVTRELKDSSTGALVNVVYRIRRKNSGYTWFEAHGSLHTEQGKGRKCLILVGRERPVYALYRSELGIEGSAGESEMWSKISTSGMFLYISSTSRVMLDRLPEDLVGTSMQALMRPESRQDFSQLLELARSGQKGTCRHDLQNRRGQVLHAQTTLYPGDARPGNKPTFLLAQTRLVKMTRAILLSQKSGVGSASPRTDQASVGSATPATQTSRPGSVNMKSGSTTTTMPSGQPIETKTAVTNPGSQGLVLGNQDEALASEDNIFDELKTTRSTSWQFELRQMEKQNRMLAEELQALLSRKKKRKRRKGLGQLEKDCANCHTRVTPEWRRGPSGNRDLCNSCGLRWAKQNGRVSPRRSSVPSDRGSTSPAYVTTTQEERQTSTQAPATLNSTGTIAPSMLQRQSTESNDSWRGNLPPKIEEGDEPPHVSNLPT
ncbi:hypothetical protein PV10_00348 [Exophiala mesophila]|uniref:White collar 1 protein n=1 Tax=Exophiala mesophila TaxID=212818 RepID=A0A0D1ZPH6_EXOME|nr:uncharacterized protein PV10_00348 [Exophiala mesophila]KIV96482.1 hypothetical protein PV10_00348 [Exophiala mesophila]